MGGEGLDFSIIIPTYNRPGPLAQCLRALTRLDYPREGFEVIVVDDGSTVPIARVADPFRSSFALTLLAIPNGGPAGARNCGAARARGRSLAFTDDDCTVAPGWLRALGARAAIAPETMVGGRTVNGLPDNLCSALSQLVLDVAYARFNADPDHAAFFASNNLAVPAGRFRELGGFDPQFTTAEDRDLCDRWLRSGGRLAFSPEAVVYHAHALTPAGLWRQHFAYGRGAYRFHTTKGRWGRFRPDGTFYRNLARAPYRREPAGRATLLALLLAVQQAANAAGFLAEMARRSGRQPRP
jgi:glycosyltransferase involved in cell wall biosynthesis